MMLVSMEARARSDAPMRCVPKIRLTTAHFTVNRGDALKPRYEDIELPVIALSFLYGERIVEAGDPDLFMMAENDTGLGAADRDTQGERRARMALESFGAVELDCLEDYGLD